MGVTDFFAGEIATELLKQLLIICKKSTLSKSSAEQLINYINQLLPTIQEIKNTGVELPQHRQRRIDDFSDTLRRGLELCNKVLHSPRWNVYKNLQLARKMEKFEKAVSQFVNGPMQTHVLADVHHVRSDLGLVFDKFDRIEGSVSRVEQRLADMKIGVGVDHGGGGWLGEAMKRVDEEERWWEGNLVTFGVGMEMGKRKVKELLIGRDELRVVGICGIGGSGKTTLARELCKDDQLKSYFGGRVFFLTVSQSPDMEELRLKIWEKVTGNQMPYSGNLFPQWNVHYEGGSVTKTLLILDDVWSLPVLEQLIFKVPGCKILVVSRCKFPPSIVNFICELELLREDEAMRLFCHFAFGQDSIPLGVNRNLVKQIVNECKGLPLALKVIGASLRDQPEMYWTSAKNRLSRSQPICETHELQLVERMKLSVEYLPEKVRECFLDLACFPEDKRIPLDVLINVWMELHDVDEEEAYAVLVELSDKNLLTLVKDSRAGEMYSSCYDISVHQHDVLRDLAIYLSNQEHINQRKRLLMPRREPGVPRDWERNADLPFNAQVVSLHTGEMSEMEWFRMDCPKAAVLILNFSSSQYFLPPFIDNMPKLRALIIINHSASDAFLHNLSVFSNLTNLRSLWLEKVSVPRIPETTTPLKSLRKMSLILCDAKDTFNESAIDIPHLFPCLTEFTMDHCINLTALPSCISRMITLRSLSITNSDSLQELPADLGMMRSLQILRIYGCPNLQKLPWSICDLLWLKYLDISQCVNLECLPEDIGGCTRLEKIDMRQCLQIKSLPRSAARLQSLGLVICDEEVSWLWQDLEQLVPGLCVQVANECFDLNWLSE